LINVVCCCSVRTVTVKLDCELLPRPSVAVAVTVVAPKGKMLPDGFGIASVGAAPQLSVAVTE
jgi:hypothetical protein